MFLTADELRALTGYKLPAFQLRWLADHGYRHEVSAGGKPVVARSFVESKIGGGLAVPQKSRPNFEALKAA